jgi:N,N'-diacetyllegionaminate synthase
MNTFPVEIIAELAQGYEGNVEQAILLLKAAAGAGADVAKYQVIYADELCTPDYKHYTLFSGLEMPDEAWLRIVNEAARLKIRIVLDVFGDRSLALAERIGVGEIMVHATDLTNMQLIQKIAESSCSRVLLGVGGALMSEIKAAVAALSSKQLVVMVGFQGYPTPDNDNQISRIEYIARELKANDSVVIGFSDHSLPDSPWVLPFSCAALGAGARVFEKHLTLGEVMKLEDYEAAINPDKFAEYARGLRASAAALGKVVPVDDFAMHDSEVRYRNMVRRCVIAAVPIKAGTVICAGDVALKRAGQTGDFFTVDSVVGRTLLTPLQINQPLRLEDVKQQ